MTMATNVQTGTVADNPALNSLATLAPLTRRSQIAATLREAILRGQLAPGSALVETKLAQQFGVSRGPLREAIRELSEEGLLLNKPYVGTYVVEVSEKTIAEAYTLRRLLDRHTFEMIWGKRDAVFSRELKRRHALLVEAVDNGELVAEIAAEMNFHRYPYEFSDSGLLLEMWELLSQKIRLGFTLYQNSMGQSHSHRDAHRKYLRCALGDDLGAMCAEIDTHIDAGLNTVLRYLRGVPNPSRRPTAL
jgi:DNA-binding GntR family transcriptional regulator